MKAQLLVLATLGLTVPLMTACGGQKSGRADTDGPVLVEAHPASGTMAVSVNEELELVFDEPVLLDNAQLRLTRRGSAAFVPVDVTVEENVVTIRAFEPLHHGGLYTLSIAGVTDADENEGAEESVEFQTSMNPLDVQVSYSSGVVSSMTVYEIDANGYAVGYDRLTDPGLDGQWLTSDDVISEYYVWTRDELGQRTGELRYQDPGPDAMWHTTDDVPSSMRNFDYSVDGFLTSVIYRSDAGPDTVFETADDVISSVGQYLLDAQGRPYRYVSLGPGADNQYFTGDDLPYYYFDSTLNAEGRAVERKTAGSSGTDGVWFTDDDYDTAMFYTYDPQGRATAVAESYDPGPDGTFSTSDDVIDYTTVFEMDSQGRGVRTITRNALDAITYHAELQRDADGNLTTWIKYLDVGTDGVPFTTDDVIDSVTEYSYDATGNRIDETQYVDPGSDSVWFTGDDVPSVTRLYTN